MKQNTSKRIIPSLLVISFIIALVPYASALFGRQVAEPDFISAFSKSTVIGTELGFTKDDFLSKVSKDAELDGIIFCDLPNPDIGVLKFDGRDILSGEALTVDGVENLKFIPYTKSEINASFTFMPVFKSGSTHEAVTVKINVLNEKNTPPTAKDLTVITARNIAISTSFQAADAEGDKILYNILDRPKIGSVELCLDNPTKFMYTPFQNKTGNDSFTYVAVDNLGNTSAPATVHIKIEKPRLRLTYADMVGNGAYYPAIVLAEKGVIKGETIGKECFLHPTNSVTRSEFITMTMALFGIKNKESVVSKIGFADDASAPVWAKPYIATAVKAGIVNGGDSKGIMVLRPQDILTRGEAAIIINNAIKLSNVKVSGTLTDHTVPVWAQQAAANVLQYNILPCYADGNLRLSNHVTRQDAVEILYNALCAKESKKK